MSPRRAPEPGEWKYTVGEVPLQLTAFERKDRGLAIYTRVWDGKRLGDVKRLGGPVRDEKGKLDPEKEIKAQQDAVTRHRTLLAGLDPEDTQDGPLTLGGGFRKVLHPVDGKYPASSKQKREVARAAKIIVEVLGGDLRWDQVRHAHFRKVWRHLAHAHKADSSQYGHRAAEMICEAFQSAARWLQQEGKIEPGEGEPARGWKQAMKKEWEEIVDRPVPKRAKPRHTEEEEAKIWASLHLADPRLALALELGAELRLGQVVERTKRSDVHLSRDGQEPLWMVEVHGRGKKLGETVVLTEDQRTALRSALTSGYLADLEAARMAGEISDFFLFPGGPLYGFEMPEGSKVLRVRATNGDRPLTASGLTRQWVRFEKDAKLPRMPGRRWYGLRRKKADDAESLSDVAPSIKNRMGGWSKSSTREGYLEQGRVEDAEKAAEVRRRIRPRKVLEQ